MKKMGNKRQVKILWGIFVFTVIIVIIDIIGEFLGLSLTKNRTIDFLKISLPVILVILHAGYTLTYFRGFVFILLASLIGLIFEIVGVKYGILFGGHYVYQVSNKLMFLSAPLFSNKLMISNIPLLVPLYWAVFIYVSYSIVSSFLFWINKGKPNRLKGGAVWLPLLVFLDGLIVVSIDLFMEPLQVKAGNWFWLEGGPYYNIPIGNFVGWFIVATISTGMFRVFEYFSPKEHSKTDKSVFVLPNMGYGMLCIVLFSTALKVQLSKLALIGFFVMFPIIIINLIVFINGQKILGENN